MKFLRALRRLARARSAPMQRLEFALVVIVLTAGCIHPAHNDPFLVCTRRIESTDRYNIDDAAGVHHGAYQFVQSTWDATARHAGWPHLVGVDPHTASAFEQDAMAWHLYEWQGKAPWGGRC